MSNADKRADSEMIDEMFAGFNVAELDAAMEAERDVLGTLAAPSSPSYDELMVKEALKGFKDAFAAVPGDKRRAYDEALDYNPKIIEIETRPERFLFFCNCEQDILYCFIGSQGAI